MTAIEHPLVPRSPGRHPVRFASNVLAAAVAMAGVAGCGTPSRSTPTLISAVSSPPAGPSSPANRSTGLTRDPCELLNPAVAKEFAGDDAQRQLNWDSIPPLPVGDDACFYKSSTRTVSFDIGVPPSDPTAAVNHFEVIGPDKRIPNLPYEAYWFGPAESLVVVKNGLLLTFKVSEVFSNGHYGAWKQSDEVRLADEIVPRVG